MSATDIVGSDAHRSAEDIESTDFITMTIADQLFGLPVLSVQDVLGPQIIAHIPLAPPEVAGSLNLRGRIVTAIDMRMRLGLEPRDEGERGMSVVVDHQGELYSLIIDTVGEVLSLPEERFERTPPTLNALWRQMAAGIYRLDERLLVVLDIDHVLDFHAAAAA